MQTIKLESWKHFEKKVALLYKATQKIKRNKFGYVSTPLFRGQAKAKPWKLDTTLERFSKEHLGVCDYYDRIAAAKYSIESFTGSQWVIPTQQEYSNFITPQKCFGLFEYPAYDYMVYLRHFGFPSPLLDWTKSPEIAAFFAFSGCPADQDGEVAIYAFCQYLGHGRHFTGGEATIFQLGHYVRTHKRHFAQQCEYTICTKKENNAWVYAPHEDAIAANKDNTQVRFIKYTIPATERLKALQDLDRKNINAYTLFGTEESLMQTVALRELLFRRQ